jgi:hypothetical protein
MPEMRTRHLGVLTLAAAIYLASPNSIRAQEADHNEHGAEAEHGEEHHKNTFSVFFGSTQAELHHGERDDPQFTLGFDYERRLNSVFGVGALVDFVLEGHREAIVAAAVIAHAGFAKFMVAPGVERVRETGDMESIIRFGLMYGFPAGKVHLEPSVFYDATEKGGTWVLGLTIGHGW